MGLLDNVLKVFGNKHEKDVKSLRPTVDEINEVQVGLQSLNDDQLRGKTKEFKEKINNHLSEIISQIKEIKDSINSDPEMDIDQKEDLYAQIDKLKEQKDEETEVVLEQILPEAFAVVKETATRFFNNETIKVKASDLDKELAVEKDFIDIQNEHAIYKNEWLAAGTLIKWNMIHYDVQLIGGMVLHQGKIAEMATGEGKTLVATLPAYLNGLVGEGVHLVTVNNYLAKRDSEWMGPIYNFLGLTCDCIDNYTPHSEERKAAYHSDITYGTNNEFGFDYLRDNMVRLPSEMVQRKHHFAMIDEVDSVLIDDARTPLIISGPVDSGDEKLFYSLKPRIAKLVEIQKQVTNQFLTDAKRLIKEGKDGHKEGEGGLALLRAYRGFPESKALIKYLSESGNRQILQKTENWYLQEQSKNMPEVDKEIYFVIEKKQNSVDLAEKGIELITGAGEDPNFFIIPDVGAQVADIDKMEVSDEEKVKIKDELIQEFAVKTERLHSVSQLLKAYALFEKEIDYVVMDGKVKIVDENTGRIMEGRRYSDGLHQAIEAKENVKVEAASQTLATVTLQNYFRMFHKLAGMTGTAETEAGEFWDIYKLDVVVIPTNRPITRDDREDLVYKTVREKYNAIIEDAVEMTKAGRPVLIGTTTVEVSELLSRMLKMKNIDHNVLNAKQHSREADIVASAGIAGAVTIATNMAGRGTDIKINEEVKKAGGLAIIGSERHDSRRIDRQLRGRAGRQGDPGSSQFFVSLEDRLMRLFGSERISKIMDRLGYKEGEVIQHSMITKSIERAQKKVEENNFGIRKRLLEYDDIMNRQREVIYKKRMNALFGERIEVDIMNTFYDLCLSIISDSVANADYNEFKLNIIRYLSLDTSISEDEYGKGNVNELTEAVFAEVQNLYKRKCDAIAKSAYPIFQDIHTNRGETVKNVAVPFSDGLKNLGVVVNLEEAIESEGRALITSFEKNVSLGIIDESWKEQLRLMDDLKQEVQTASYEQKDPLLIYKLEAYNLFESMINHINKDVASFLLKGNIPTNNAEDLKAAQQQKTNTQSQKAGREDLGGLVDQNRAAQNALEAQRAQNQPKKLEPVRVAKKVGRNDPCPCGSGKKFKKCHGAGGE